MHELSLERLGAYAAPALAAAFVGLGLLEQLVRADTDRSLRAIAWTLAIGALILVGHTRPVVATCATALLVLALPETDGTSPPGAYAYALPVVLSYWCGAHASTRSGAAATLALVAALQVHAGFADAPNLEIAIATLPPWWGGLEVRRRRRLVRELASKTRELEAEEEAFVRLSVERERARIARDLHDIVSHHLALIVIQAGAGRLAEPWHADAAGDRFATIREAGVEALAETDRLVALLTPDPNDLARLAPLLDRARALGARVAVSPPDLELLPELEAVAHHVTREALTNAMKHAPGAPLDIRLTRDQRALTITIRNDPVAATSAVSDTGSRLGLVGIRERVSELGGSLDAGLDIDGGFRLRATLPLEKTGLTEPSGLPSQPARL